MKINKVLLIQQVEENKVRYILNLQICQDSSVTVDCITL